MSRMLTLVAAAAALSLAPFALADDQGTGSPRPDENVPGSDEPGTATGGMAADGTATKGETNAKTNAKTNGKTKGNGAAWTTLEGPGLRYEWPRYGGEARLLVLPDGATDTTRATAWRVYRGKDLGTILRDEPELALRPGVQELRDRAEKIDSNGVPTRVSGSVQTWVEAPGLVYQRGIGEECRIYVTQPDRTTLAYVGRDFDAILAANPTLASTPGWNDFRARVEAADAVVMPTLRRDASGVLDVHHTPSGVVLNTYAWRDGEWARRTVRGRTFQEIHARGDLRGWVAQDAGMRPDARPRSGNGGCPFSGNAMEDGEDFVRTSQRRDVRPPPPPTPARPAPAAQALRVAEGSAAARLGLREGDVIVEIDGREIRDGEAFRRELEANPPAESARIVVMRQGKRVTLGAN